MASPDSRVPIQGDMETSARADDLRASFLRMNICFAIVHGFATTPLVYASSVLDKEVAYVGNGTLYILMIFSALVLAIPTISKTSLKGGLVVGSGLYSGYVLGFSIAAFSTDYTIQMVFFVLGSICGGLAAGIIWTAEGDYMAHAATAISNEEKTPHMMITSELATQFAFYYLLFEEISKLLMTGVMAAGMSVQAAGLLYLAVVVAGTAGMTMVSDIKPIEDEEKPPFEKLLGTVRLWSDARVWLISPTNITFGLAAAYMNGQFNANVGSKVLGKSNLGLLAAFTVAVSFIVTKLYGFLGQRYGNLVPLSIGAVSFACIAVLMLTIKGIHTWGWAILVFYALQGSGRAVFEGANKAVFADTFKGKDTQAAFSNQVLQMGIASAICFFASAYTEGKSLLYAIVIAAVLTPIAYIAKTSLDSVSGESDPLLAKSA